MDHGRRISFPAVKTAVLEPYGLDDRPLEDDEVFGTTLATLLSPGTELALYRGDSGLPHPIRPGYAAVARIERCGAGVGDVRPGDCVFGMFPHQSAIRGRRRDVVPVPAGLDPKVAVFARLLSIPMSVLTATAARPPQRVLVQGLGIVGHLCVQVFARCGYDVLAVDADPTRRALAARALEGTSGAVLDRTPLDRPDLVGRVALVLACRSGEDDVLDACRIVGRGGEVFLVGVPWARKSDRTAHELLDAVFHRYAVLRSGWEWQIPTYPDGSLANSVMDDFRTALDWLRQDRIRTEGLSTAIRPEEAPDAFRRLDDRSGEALTHVVDWSGSHA